MTALVTVYFLLAVVLAVVVSLVVLLEVAESQYMRFDNHTHTSVVMNGDRKRQKTTLAETLPWHTLKNLV